MKTELLIEHYLLQVDRQLKALPIGRRAEILTECKARISALCEKSPTLSYEGLVAEMGSPRVLAEAYLQKEGLAPARASRGRWLKPLAVTTVLLGALIFISGMVMIWYLTPIARIDRASGRITLLGGWVDINETLGRVKIGGIQVNDALKEGLRVRGEEDLSNGTVKMIKIPFNTAKLKLSSSTDRVMRWDCKAAGDIEPKTELSAGVLTFNLDRVNLAKCSIALPRGTASEFTGYNGNVDVEAPLAAMDIRLTNGKVNIHPDPSRVYDFEVKVKNGLQDFFPRSPAKDAIHVKVSVMNGLVNKSE